MSQTDQILKALKSGKKITTLDALYDYQCFRLSGRILELRQQGYNVLTKIVKTHSGKRIAEYSLNSQLKLF